MLKKENSAHYKKISNLRKNWNIILENWKHKRKMPISSTNYQKVYSAMSHLTKKNFKNINK